MVTVTLNTWLAGVIVLALAASLTIIVVAIGYAIMLFADKYYTDWKDRRKGKFFRAEWQDAKEEPSPSKFPIVVACGCPSEHKLIETPQEYHCQRLLWQEFCKKYRIVYWVSLNDVKYLHL